MEDDAFEWDDAKEAANRLRHGIPFELASRVFDDPNGDDVEDTRRDYGERRYNRVGRVAGALLHVTYTERGERIRIISARVANRYERSNYRRANPA